MKRRCERCDYEINAKYLIKQDSFDKIICPNCGRTLVAKDISKVLGIIIFVVIFTMFLFFPLNYLEKVIIEVGWLLIYRDILPAFIYSYEEIKNDVNP